MRTRATIILAGAALLLALTGCASVPMAPAERDAQARELNPDPDAAVIYVIRDSSLGAAVTLPVWLNGSMVGALAYGTFFRWDVEPGEHKIASQGENYDQVELSADKGELHFVRLNARMGWAQPRVAFSILDEEKAREIITGVELAEDQR